MDGGKQRDKSKIAELFPIIREIRNQDLADRIAAVWLRAWGMSKWERLEDACFNPDIQERDCRLVDHVNVTTIASLQMAKLIERYQGESFNYERILTIGLLHDVSKLLEYEPDGKGGYRRSFIGEKLQHGFYGAVLAREEGFTEETLHLILTHTPQSKMKPQYKEAILFSYMDLCDADMVFYERGLPLFAE
ncbi:MULTISPECIES: HD domain-containing protein [Anaerotruncus]|uniref:HD domain-containing protein n=1 Tax=Anaerotruncus TaxID=244127 RepID=UPI000C756E77|nr:HD domain-containing protein [Anaerotruncus massiliensis (ex Togo et al. 2019)]